MKQNTSLIMLGVVALLAVVTLNYLFTEKSVSGMPTYQQTLNKQKIIDYDALCQKFPGPSGGGYYLETDELTGNIICIYPDGSTKQLSPKLNQRDVY